MSVYHSESLPIRVAQRACVAFLSAFLVASTAGCDLPWSTSTHPALAPDTDPTQGEEPPTPAGVPPSDVNLSDFHWYQVDRLLDQEGNETRTLLTGSLDGTLTGEIPLGNIDVAARQGQLEEFAWSFPQVAGVFGTSAIAWGRQREAASIEVVDLSDGSVEPLVTIGEPIHVATADDALARIFYVTAAPESRTPTGLWALDLTKAADPWRLNYEFDTEPLTSRFGYRLMANRDGSVLAIQAEEGDITALDLDTGASREIAARGPMIGFADDDLLAYGPRTDTERPSLMLFAVDGQAREVIVNEVDSAQIVKGTEGDLIVFLRIDPTDPRSYEVGVVFPQTGESRVAYTHDPVTIGPLLARRDRTPLAAGTPMDWVLLVDSFLPFVESPRIPWKDPPASTYPMLLQLLTGENFRVGPFR